MLATKINFTNSLLPELYADAILCKLIRFLNKLKCIETKFAARNLATNANSID